MLEHKPAPQNVCVHIPVHLYDFSLTIQEDTSVTLWYLVVPQRRIDAIEILEGEPSTQ